VEVLWKRFTPVHIQSVHSILFHDRKQNSGESVDSYAQDLKRLFYQAYPKASQSHSETETLGKSVLSSQFVADLELTLKSKVARSDGDLEQLWVRARFEEAKIQDLQSMSPNQPSASQCKGSFKKSTGAISHRATHKLKMLQRLRTLRDPQSVEDALIAGRQAIELMTVLNQGSR
jgi:hypothetical protein